MTDFDHDAFVTALKDLLANLPAGPAGIDRKTTVSLRREISDAIVTLDQLQRQLDPIKQPAYVLDPANPQEMGNLIARVLLEQVEIPFLELSDFYGSGVYALYYRGDFDVYCVLKDKQTPIYVGCAAPERTDARNPTEQGIRLARRLKDHLRSIKHADNLRIEDFRCRYLVVVSAWQSAAEERLISMFNPVWNNETGVCQGFGKHGDDPDTRANARSPWDTLHPGRPWAKGAPDHENTVEEIKRRIEDHFRQYPPN